MCGAIGEPSGRVIDWDRIERFVVTIPVDGGYQSQSVGKEAVTAVLTDGYSVERERRPHLTLDELEERGRYPTGRGMWSVDEIKRITRETIGEYGLVPNNYAQVEHGPVTGVSEKAGDATDDLSRVEYGIGVQPPTPQRDATDGSLWSHVCPNQRNKDVWLETGLFCRMCGAHKDATDGEFRPPTPESKWSPDRLVQEVVSWYSVVWGVTLDEDYRRDLELYLSRIQEGG